MNGIGQGSYFLTVEADGYQTLEEHPVHFQEDWQEVKITLTP